jgi:hypothetical protein
LEERGLSRVASPILYVYDSVEEICWESLPNKFVIKKSNASGYNIIITDKNKANEEKVKKQMKRWMKTPCGYIIGSPIYEKMQPKIVIEKYIENIGKDWKIFCVNGKPEILVINHWVYEYNDCVKVGRKKFGAVFSNLSGEILDVIDFGNAEVRKGYTVGEMLELPSDFDEMIELSKILSEEFPLVRADFYHGDNKLILGELTFSPSGGLLPYAESFNDELGRKLVLPSLSDG